MLREWLQSSPNPTWSNLIEALRSPDINRPDIAAEIEDVYIKSDDSSLQESKDTAGEYCMTAWSLYTLFNAIYSKTTHIYILLDCYDSLSPYKITNARIGGENHNKTQTHREKYMWMALSCNGLLFSCRISCFPRPIPAIFTLQMFFNIIICIKCVIWLFINTVGSCAHEYSSSTADGQISASSLLYKSTVKSNRKTFHCWRSTLTMWTSMFIYYS